LSEGEQRVVAMAGFFAELALARHTCPIVFDDPVTSLDHLYREKIAARLVAEATKRQVLVLTHDIAFLLELQHKAGELGGVFFTSQTIARQNGVVGVSASQLPWHAMSVKKRLNVLRDRLSDCRYLHPTDVAQYNDKAAMIYALLRETWEATVEEKVLHGTILRHGSEVKTQQLRYVGVTTELYRQIYVGMSKCSMWMYGHDKSKALSVNRPDPSEVEQDINALSTFVKKTNVAAESRRKERDAALKPETPAIG